MKVLIVEDSISISQIIRTILESDMEIQVAAVVVSGEDAISYIQNNKVDVITMDFNLAGMDGIIATREIMSTLPVPIIIMSSSFDPKNSKDVFRALEAGAIGVFDKPHSLGSDAFNKYASDLIRHVKLLSEVKVVTRRKPKYKNPLPGISRPSSAALNLKEDKIKLIAIGSSTGGPQVLKEIFSKLDSNFPVPIVVVQHIAEHFTEPMAKWLNDQCHIEIKLAADNEILLPGKVYFAPDSKHLTVNHNLVAILNDSPPVHSSKPSVSKLFESVANNVASNAVGILLTGMGRDGATELKELKDAGAITIAQNKESCVVFGMPNEAIKQNGATYIYSPTEIINFLLKIREVVYATPNIHR